MKILELVSVLIIYVFRVSINIYHINATAVVYIISMHFPNTKWMMYKKEMT